MYSLGGAAYLYNSQFKFQNCKFINNSAIAYGYNATIEGGALRCSEAEIQLLFCTFDHNFVLSQKHSYGTYGGSVSLINSKLIINSTIFQNNYISCLGDAHNYNNIGGALEAFYSNYDLNNCTFSSNSISLSASGGGSGGSIFFQESKGTIVKSSFTKNSAISSVSQTYMQGGAISLFHTLLTIDDSTFTDNSNQYCNDIYISNFQNKYGYNSLTTIKNCKFYYHYKSTDYIQHLICFNCDEITYMYYQFLNNKIYITNTDLSGINVFFIYGSSVRCKCQNNCISPYNDHYFSTNYNPFYDENGDKLQFEDAFNLNCFPTATPSRSRSPTKSLSPSKSRTPTKSRSPTKSLTPTSSNFFTKSFEFSESNKFSFSNYFEQTNYFSFSMKFSESIYFSLSKAFDESNVFSNSKLFSESMKFSKSNEFDKTSFFTSSKDFTKSNYFIDSNIFSNSLQFTNSKKFTKSNNFAQTGTFTNSKFFSYSNDFTNSKIFSNSNIFSNSKTFTHSNLFSSSNTFINLTSSNSFSNSNYFTYIGTPTPLPKDATLFMSLSISYSYVKTVTYSVSNDYSNFYVMSYIPDLQTYSFICTMSSYKYYFPYIILSLSPSYVPSYFAAKMPPPKKITQENLIGIVCGCVAGVFIILSVIIFIIKRKNKIRKFIESESLVSSDDELSNVETYNGITVTNNSVENDAEWI